MFYLLLKTDKMICEDTYLQPVLAKVQRSVPTHFWSLALIMTINTYVALLSP